jgi:hypothetical protein
MGRCREENTMSTASKVAEHKKVNPLKYCYAIGCLWRTNEQFCPRHKPIAPYKAQARQIAKWYNELIKAERRYDLEE